VHSIIQSYEPENNPEQIYLREERLRKVRQTIARLPDRYRVVLVLFHYENLSYRQIAETLDIPAKTVATRLYRAKLLLKEVLADETKAGETLTGEAVAGETGLMENRGGERDGMP